MKELIELKKELPYKWKIQTKPKTDKKWVCVAYIDSRDVQDLLDEVCWADKWQNEFYEVKGKVFCKIWIKVWDDWVWKSDSWALEESEHIDTETTSKWETSDAFKRAWVQWGIGRFLYTKEMYWITEEEYNANKFKLTAYINSRDNTKSNTPKTDDKPKKWLNYESFKEIVDAWNTDKVSIWKVITEDWFSLSNNAKIAITNYLETWIIAKDLFFPPK